MVPAAMQNFSMVFTGINPVKEGWWACKQDLEEACSAVHTQSALCSFPRTAWYWTSRYGCDVSYCNICLKSFFSQLRAVQIDLRIPTAL